MERLEVENMIREGLERSDLGVLVRQLQGQLVHSKGVATLSFVANNDANVTVAHGLRDTPSNVQVTPRSAGTSSIRAPACDTRDATNIRINARSGDGTSVTMDVEVDWVAWL